MQTCGVIVLLVFTIGPIAEIKCFNQNCKIGYEFWESEKEICRQCSDFADYCFQDVKHIANCSSFCKGLLPKPQPCDNSNELYMYMPTGVCIIVICIFLIPTIVRKCKKYRKLKRGMRSTPTIDDEREPDTCLMKADELPQDLNEPLNEVRTEHLNGFVPLNQIPNTNHDRHSVMPTGTKYLDPRYEHSMDIHGKESE